VKATRRLARNGLESAKEEQWLAEDAAAECPEGPEGSQKNLEEVEQEVDLQAKRDDLEHKEYEVERSRGL
jgi:hypothetical protein